MKVNSTNRRIYELGDRVNSIEENGKIILNNEEYSINEMLILDYTANYSCVFAYRNAEGKYIQIKDGLSVKTEKGNPTTDITLLDVDEPESKEYTEISPRVFKEDTGLYKLEKTIDEIVYSIDIEVIKPPMACYSENVRSQAKNIDHFNCTETSKSFYIICEYEEGDEIEITGSGIKEIPDYVNIEDQKRGVYKVTIDESEMTGGSEFLNLSGICNNKNFGFRWQTGVSIPIYKSGATIEEGKTETIETEGNVLTLPKPNSGDFNSARSRVINTTPQYFSFYPEGEGDYFLDIQLKENDVYTEESWGKLEKTMVKVYDSTTGALILSRQSAGRINLPEVKDGYYIEVCTGVKGFEARMDLSKMVSGEVTILYDESKGDIKFGETNNQGESELVGEPTVDETTGLTKQVVRIWHDYYFGGIGREVAFEIIPANGKKCTGFYSKESDKEKLANYNLCYSHNFDITDANGNLITHNIENSFGTSLPAKDFYCCTYIYSNHDSSSIGWEDVNEMIRVCNEKNYLAK